jgi:hypothetical protein
MGVFYELQLWDFKPFFNNISKIDSSYRPMSPRGPDSREIKFFECSKVRPAEAIAYSLD